MRVTMHSSRIWAMGMLLVASLMLCAPLAAQNTSPTSDQLDVLRSMSPSDRDSLMRSVGIDPNSLHSDSQTGNAQVDRNGQAVNPPLPAPQPEDLQARERARLFLQPGDSVIIQIDFHLPPLVAPTDASGNPLPANAQQTGRDMNAPASAAAAAAAANSSVANAPSGPPGANPQQQQQDQKPGADLPIDEQDRLHKLMGLIRARNPYQLSRDGVIWLPGISGIQLAGLNEAQATLRLQSEPAFENVEVRLIRLPLDKNGEQALKPFGYDLFDQAPSTFAPVTEVPVPADYVVGPGDIFDIQLYGSDNRSLNVTVSRDGSIDLPQLGPVRIAGMRFHDAKESIESRVQKQLIGVRANVSMSDTRAIRVFVMGEAKRAGSYVVSGLGTITSALYAAGGVKPIGSLRHIQLKRQGRLIRELDLYDLLLRGDTTDDAKLLPGDVIFVPPIGASASVFGEIQRPAIYELHGETSVAQLVALGGGVTPEADPTRAVLTQIDDRRQRNVTEVDLSHAQSGPALRNGDSLRIDRLRPTLDSAVTLRGHLYTTGTVAFHKGLRLSQVITSVDQLQPNADLHYLLIRREVPPQRRTEVFSADLAAALAEPGSTADVELAPRDQIMVFDLESGRDRLIQPLLDELRLQSSLQRPTEVVRIDGRAKVPGEYPLEPNMSVSDLLRAGGGLEDAAYGGRAELSRYVVENGEARRTQLIPIDLAAVLRGDKSADVKLQAFDSLSIKEVQDWGGQETITLMGEVRFPGKYSLKRGETLRSVLERAGGLNEHAFPEGSVFTRTELRDREQKQLDTLAVRLQSDLATLALQGAAANQAQAAQALTVGQSLLAQLRGSRAVGRLVIDLPSTMHATEGSESDLLLRDGDMLIVPRRPQEVTVIGEVQSPTSHLYRERLARNDYVDLSGGTTRKADVSSTYVVRADGSVIAHGGSRWFRGMGGRIAIKPGDTIVVPLDTERLPSLPFWQAVTSILYNVAISAAAVNSF